MENQTLHKKIQEKIVQLKENQSICFGCGYHLQMNSQERITHLIDAGTWRPLDEIVSPCDPLQFCDQKKKCSC